MASSSASAPAPDRAQRRAHRASLRGRRAQPGSAARHRLLEDVVRPQLRRRAMGVTTQRFRWATRRTPSTTEVREVITPDRDEALCGNDQAILILKDNIAAPEAKLLVPRVDVDVAAKDDILRDRLRRDAGRRAAPAPGSAAVSTSSSSIAPGNLSQQPTGTQSSRWSSSAITASARATPAGLRSICRTGSSASLARRRRLPSPVYSDVFGLGRWIKETACTAPRSAATRRPRGRPATRPIRSTTSRSATRARSRRMRSRTAVHRRRRATYCTRPCNETALCPDGYTCDDASRSASRICQRRPPSQVDGRRAAAGGRLSHRLSGERLHKPVPWLARRRGSSPRWR